MNCRLTIISLKPWWQARGFKQEVYKCKNKGTWTAVHKQKNAWILLQKAATGCIDISVSQQRSGTKATQEQLKAKNT